MKMPKSQENANDSIQTVKPNYLLGREGFDSSAARGFSSLGLVADRSGYLSFVDEDDDFSVFAGKFEKKVKQIREYRKIYM